MRMRLFLLSLASGLCQGLSINQDSEKARDVQSADIQSQGVTSGTLPYLGSTPGTPKYRPTAKRVSLKYGPLNLLGKDTRKPVTASLSMDPKGQGGLLSINKGLCNNCTILGARYRLSYADGRDALPKDGVYIHHMVSFDTSKRGVSVIGSCGGVSAGGARSTGQAYFLDRGEDSGQTETIFTSADGKYNSGFHVGSAPRISMQYDIVNYKNQQQDVFINLDYEYVEGRVGSDAGYTLKSVTGCGNGMSPKTSTTRAVSTTARLPILADATIIYARGHLHAGGEKMIMKLNDKTVCQAIPTYNAAGVITSMSLCPDSILVKKGNTLTIESVYDLTRHKLRESTDGNGHGAQGRLGGSDVMGMFAIAYALK